MKIAGVAMAGKRSQEGAFDQAASVPGVDHDVFGAFPGMAASIKDKKKKRGRLSSAPTEAGSELPAAGGERLEAMLVFDDDEKPDNEEDNNKGDDDKGDEPDGHAHGPLSNNDDDNEDRINLTGDAPIVGGAGGGGAGGGAGGNGRPSRAPVSGATWHAFMGAALSTPALAPFLRVALWSDPHAFARMLVAIPQFTKGTALQITHGASPPSWAIPEEAARARLGARPCKVPGVRQARLGVPPSTRRWPELEALVLQSLARRAPAAAIQPPRSNRRDEASSAAVSAPDAEATEADRRSWRPTEGWYKAIHLQPPRGRFPRNIRGVVGSRIPWGGLGIAINKFHLLFLQNTSAKDARQGRRQAVPVFLQKCRKCGFGNRTTPEIAVFNLRHSHVTRNCPGA